MASYTTSQLRNVALLGHGGSGKTTLAEALLFNTGAVSRRGRVEDGTTVSDWDEEEIRRRMSVSLSVVPCEVNGNKVNLLDAPGFMDLAGEAISAVTVADAGLLVLDAASGVEVGTELGWNYLNDRGLARAVFVNKMDRENARFQGAVNALREQFSGTIVPVQLPIGEGAEFRGIVDLISGKAYVGESGEATDVPGDMADAVEEARLQLIEASAEGDDELIMKYLEGEELTSDEINRGLRQGVVKGTIFPVFCGSAAANVGTRQLIESMIAFLPNPLESPAVVAERPNGEQVSLTSDSAGPLAAFVFKTWADPFVGKVSYFRVFSGALQGDSRAYSMPGGNEERIGPVFTPRGKEQLSTQRVVAGDIGGVTKLASTLTNDTLCDKAHALTLPRPNYPEPLFSVAVNPKTRADSAKMGPTLTRLSEEDPTLRWRFEQGTGQTILSGMGEIHIDLAVKRTEAKFGVGLVTSVPKVPYNESITRNAADFYRHKKQTGGAGQFAEVHMEIKPLERGRGFEFDTSRVFGGAIQNSFFPSIEKGIRSMLDSGPVAGYPVVDVRCEVYDGKMHPVDSKDIAFQIAGREVFKKTFLDAGPVLLEPVMEVTITVPEEYTGDIMGDLNTRRGRVLGMEQTRARAWSLLMCPWRRCSAIRSICAP